MATGAFTLIYYVCVLTGTADKPYFETCFADRLLTSHAMDKLQCEEVGQTLKAGPQVIERPKKGVMRLGIVMQTKCVQERDT